LRHQEIQIVFKRFLKIEAESRSIESLFSPRTLHRIDYEPYCQRNYVWDTAKGETVALVAKKWGYSKKRKNVGRPRVPHELVDLVLRFARENPSCPSAKNSACVAAQLQVIKELQAAFNILT
jgi:hypothetical protein